MTTWGSAANISWVFLDQLFVSGSFEVSLQTVDSPNASLTSLLPHLLSLYDTSWNPAFPVAIIRTQSGTPAASSSPLLLLFQNGTHISPRATPFSFRRETRALSRDPQLHSCLCYVFSSYYQITLSDFPRLTWGHDWNWNELIEEIGINTRIE